eukprot:998376-Rhodomonas_salina.1
MAAPVCGENGSCSEEVFGGVGHRSKGVPERGLGGGGMCDALRAPPSGPCFATAFNLPPP